jgi:hypothetical protein
MNALSRIAAACLLIASPCWAETLHYQGAMTGPGEVPPTTSAGTGTAEATLDTVSGKLDWTLTWKGLTGPATMAHFHGPAAAGHNAGVVIPLGMAPVSPITGSVTLTPAQAADLKAGLWYANVHTKKNPKGEIRGQMLPGK